MDDTRVPISDVINAAPLSALQIRVLLLCCILVVLDGFDAAVIGYIAPTLTKAWHISPQALAPVFAAGLFGMFAGATGLGIVADRYGRKIVLILSLMIVAAGTLGTVLTDTVMEMTALRFITGIGMGAILPNSITLAAEYSPARRKIVLVTLSYSGFTLGLAAGGWIAGIILPAFGWHGLLLTGGIAPLLLIPIAIVWLPESLCFMAGRDRYRRQLNHLVSKITDVKNDAVCYSNNETVGISSPVGALFHKEIVRVTLVLWCAFFAFMFVFYLLTSWLPMILSKSGYPLTEMSHIAAMLPLGGVIGGIVMATLLDRLSSLHVLTVASVIAAITLTVTGAQLQHPQLLLAAIFILGFTLTGTMNNLSVLASTFYPTHARATGVSWALSAGRAGSICGSLSGGLLFSQAQTLSDVFIWLACPIAVACVALELAGSRKRNQAE